MTWSYSRIKAFDDCPHRWYLKYIRFPQGTRKELFFSSYGIFMHELLEAFFKGEKTADQLQSIYLKDYLKRVKSSAPNHTVYERYFMDGLRYLKTVRPLRGNLLCVEQKAEFRVDGFPFVAYLDLLERDGNGIIRLIDNKSKILKLRSNRQRPTKSDIELDAYLLQLYLYSIYVFGTYGKYPEKLCFNCFRNNLLIEEPFNETAFYYAKNWFLKHIEKITANTDFLPNMDWFKCKYLCEMQDHCEYYEQG